MSQQEEADEAPQPRRCTDIHISVCIYICMYIYIYIKSMYSAEGYIQILARIHIYIYILYNLFELYRRCKNFDIYIYIYLFFVYLFICDCSMTFCLLCSAGCGNLLGCVVLSCSAC